MKKGFVFLAFMAIAVWAVCPAVQCADLNHTYVNTGSAGEPAQSTSTYGSSTGEKPSGNQDCYSPPSFNSMYPPQLPPPICMKQIFDVKVHTPFEFGVDSDDFLLDKGWGQAFMNIRLPVQLSHIRDMKGMELRLEGLPEDVTIKKYGWTETDFDEPGIFVKTSGVKVEDFNSLETMRNAGWEMRADLEVKTYNFDPPLGQIIIIGFCLVEDMESLLSNGKNTLYREDRYRYIYPDDIMEFFREYLPGVRQVSFKKAGEYTFTYRFDEPIGDYLSRMFPFGLGSSGAIYFSDGLGDYAQVYFQED